METRTYDRCDHTHAFSPLSHRDWVKSEVSPGDLALVDTAPPSTPSQHIVVEEVYAISH